MKKQLTFILAVIFISFLVSCGPSAEEKANHGNSDTVSAQPDTSVIYPTDSAIVDVEKAITTKKIRKLGSRQKAMMNDTTFISEPVEEPATSAQPTAEPAEELVVPSKKTEGTLVYYCPTRMLENTANNISVTITKAALQQAKEQLGKKVAASTGKTAEKIEKDINGGSIAIADKMKVELKYSDKDFETIYKPENEDQIFDGVNDMNWDWIIKPTKVGNIQITIIVSAFDNKSGRWISVQTPPKIYNIKVQVDPRGYFAKLWGFLESNPEWLFIQILIPLVTFFYGRKRGKKSK
ncbi:MAG: hypothetical protein WCI92_14665 [Bacteroidota bacterium]